MAIKTSVCLWNRLFVIKIWRHLWVSKAQLTKAFQKAQKEEDEELDAYRKVRLRQQRQALDKDLFNSQRTLAEESKVLPSVRVSLR